MVEREPDGTGRRRGAVLSTIAAGGRQGHRPATRWDAYVVAGALVCLSALAWSYVALSGDDAMAVGALTGSSGADSMGMADPPAGMSLGFFLATWTVMMVAMMFPATSPVVLLFDRWRRHRGGTPLLTVGFVAAYLVVWSAAGLVAYAALAAITAYVTSPAAATVLGGLTLAVAGGYQLTSQKQVCLTRCRSPLSFVMAHARRLGQGFLGPVRVGLSHGAYCLGCCWAFMAVLLMLGVMNPLWMAAVSAVILVEKLLPAGRRLGQVTGIALMAVGASVLASGLTS